MIQYFTSNNNFKNHIQPEENSCRKQCFRNAGIEVKKKNEV